MDDEENKNPCTQPNCCARTDDCTDNDEMCFWKDSLWKKEQDKTEDLQPLAP